MDWKALVSTVAPWLGTALGGPLGGMAVTAIGNALGLDDKSEASIKKALSGITPEQMLAIRNSEQEFKARMIELGFKNQADMAKIAADDTKDARDLQKSTKSVIPPVLACVIVTLVCSTEAALLFGSMPHIDGVVLGRIMGTLDSALMLVLSFYFGSSNGSERKTELMAQQAGNSP